MNKVSLMMAVLILVTSGISLYSEETYDGNLLENAAPFWEEMGHDARVMYLQGVLSGLYATYNEIRKNDQNLAQRMQSIMPWKVTINEIIAIIDRVYRHPQFRDIPVWYITVNLDQMQQKLNIL